MAWVAPNSLKEDKKYIINGVEIKEYLLKNHNVNNIQLPTKRTNKFKGVVIHNTNIAKSEDDGRQYTAATLNNAMASRTHYYVTDLSAWKNLEDDDMNWTCGDGAKGEGNNGCISLEIIMDSRTKEKDLKARDNGARIAAAILVANNMTIDDMYTHNYFLNVRDGVKGSYEKLCTTATPTRNCPYYIVYDWDGFRRQVSLYINLLKGNTGNNIVINNNKYIFKAISQAAIRTDMSKSSRLIDRVVKGNYYLAEQINNKWIKHVDTTYYSMLVDGSQLFEKIGVYKTQFVTTNVNIRSAPTVKSDSITVVKKGSIVYIFDEVGVKNEGYTWKRIIINNRIGYIASDYLSNG